MDSSWRFTPATSRALRRSPRDGAPPVSCFETGGYYANKETTCRFLQKPGKVFKGAGKDLPGRFFSSLISLSPTHGRRSHWERGQRASFGLRAEGLERQIRPIITGLSVLRGTCNRSVNARSHFAYMLLIVDSSYRFTGGNSQRPLRPADGQASRLHSRKMLACTKITARIPILPHSQSAGWRARTRARQPGHGPSLKAG
jgi:hypothetical protein